MSERKSIFRGLWAERPEGYPGESKSDILRRWNNENLIEAQREENDRLISELRKMNEEREERAERKEKEREIEKVRREIELKKHNEYLASLSPNERRIYEQKERDEMKEVFKKLIEGCEQHAKEREITEKREIELAEKAKRIDKKIKFVLAIAFILSLTLPFVLN
jgi:hypothetical protein